MTELPKHISVILQSAKHLFWHRKGVQVVSGPEDSDRYRPCVWLLLIDSDKDAHGSRLAPEDITKLVIDPDELARLARHDHIGMFNLFSQAIDRCIENTRTERAEAKRRALLFPQWSPYP